MATVADRRYRFDPNACEETEARDGPPPGVPTPALSGSGSWVGNAPAFPSQPSSRSGRTGRLPGDSETLGPPAGAVKKRCRLEPVVRLYRRTSPILRRARGIILGFNPAFVMR